MTDFSRLRLRRHRRQYLIAPSGYTPDAPHRVAPIFDRPVHRLAGDLRSHALAEPGISLKDISIDGRQLELMHRSPVLKLTTRISCHFIPLSDTQSTLAIYSRTKYASRSANQKRIDAWLAAIGAPADQSSEMRLQPAASPASA